MKRSSRNGWRWLVNIANHIGAAAIAAGGLGSLFLSWTVSRWWITAAYIVAVIFVSFTAGAYNEYRQATQDIGNAIVVSLDATVRQLRGERGRANNWLKTLREAKSVEDGERQADVIEHIFDVFWLQTLQTIIEPRSRQFWAAFKDEADDALFPVGATERERVFSKVQLAVKRLDTVIVEFETQAQEIRKLLLGP